ncbi:hypothetical protein ACLOJK_020057 [Asimina triloba]
MPKHILHPQHILHQAKLTHLSHTHPRPRQRDTHLPHTLLHRLQWVIPPKTAMATIKIKFLWRLNQEGAMDSGKDAVLPCVAAGSWIAASFDRSIGQKTGYRSHVNKDKCLCRDCCPEPSGGRPRLDSRGAPPKTGFEAGPNRPCLALMCCVLCKLKLENVGCGQYKQIALEARPSVKS